MAAHPLDPITGAPLTPEGWLEEGYGPFDGFDDEYDDDFELSETWPIGTGGGGASLSGNTSSASGVLVVISE